MEELRRVLSVQAKRYPRMEPTDAVKLVYQNEFGGGHLIRDTKIFWDRLYQEYAAVEKEQAVALCEHIGNGVIRVNLARLAEKELPLLGEAFLASWQEKTGKMEQFLEKLEILRQETEKGIMPFDVEQLERYMAAYEKNGYAPASHSEQYRNAYHPAYRVIRKKK